MVPWMLLYHSYGTSMKHDVNTQLEGVLVPMMLEDRSFQVMLEFVFDSSQA